MLKKLLKYDLKWTYKPIVIFYILALLLSCLGRLFSLIDNSLIFDIISKICNGAAISMMVSSLINSIMRLWARFVKNLYKDESYLTHTLPINIKTIYLSKVLSGIIILLTTTIIILISIFICYYSKDNLELLKQSLQLVAQTYSTTVIKLLLQIAFIFFLETIFILLIGYTGIIIGHKYNKNKMSKSILIGIILYFITQIITMISIVIYGLFNQDIMNLIKTTDTISVNAIKSVIYLSSIIYIIYNIFYYILDKKQLEKGINID